MMSGPCLNNSYTQLGQCVGIPGVLSGTSIEGNAGTWTPSTISTAMAGSIVYTFNPTNTICFNPTTMTVVVNAAASPTFTPSPSYCAGDPIPALPTTSNNGYTGTWSPALTTQRPLFALYPTPRSMCFTYDLSSKSTNPPYLLLLHLQLLRGRSDSGSSNYLP
ncbi:MAG: hypothetical protein IPL69_15605 [Saprospiraceae bacterium]|nr:hypothetical protein [Candidatus Brachybacter algidus]